MSYDLNKMLEKKNTLQPPEGLFYIPDFINGIEEQHILNSIENLPFGRSMLGVFEAKRTVVHYGGEGYKNNYGETHTLNALPTWIEPIRTKCASIISLQPRELKQILVTRYEEAGIGWHRDAPHFGPVVLGLSIGGANRMRFKRFLPDAEEHFQILLEPRSLYIMSGAARSAWQHSMPTTKQLRFSITFRTVKGDSHIDEEFKTKVGAPSSNFSNIEKRLGDLNLLNAVKTNPIFNARHRNTRHIIEQADGIQLKLPI